MTRLDRPIGPRAGAGLGVRSRRVTRALPQCQASGAAATGRVRNDGRMHVETSNPSAEGVDAGRIAAFLDAIEADPRVEPHGLIIQRHGRRIAEGYWAPHAASDMRLVYSVSKSFTGTALGLMIGEGRLGLDDLVVDHLPDLVGDGVDERTARMRIRHIATMATGHDREMIDEARRADPSSMVRGLLHIPPDAEPGTLFAYSQPPVLALATILQRLAGERLVDYLRPRLLEPLGIDSFRWAQHTPGVDLGYSGVYTNLDALARLGQLYLDGGRCDGRPILPDGWVAEASSIHVSNAMREEPDWKLGYGIQLWRSAHGYRGDGAFGQYMVVLPDMDAVVAMFSCTETMQAVLDAMWEHLIPALSGGRPADPALDAVLADRLRSLRRPTAAERLGAHPYTSATGRFAPGVPVPSTQPTITAVDLDGSTLTYWEHDERHDVPVGGSWSMSPDGLTATSAAELADGRVAVDLVLLDTPHRLELLLDPSTSTFSATWPIVPLFGLSPDNHLSNLRLPAD